MTAIELRNVTLAFGARPVLTNIDLAINNNEFIGVLGANGSGKTTLMRLIAGLDRPNRGRAAIAGHNVDGLQPDVRLLFQDSRLLPWQRVLGNVGIARTPGWREAAEAALAEVGLQGFADRDPATLSGGQAARAVSRRGRAGR